MHKSTSLAGITMGVLAAFVLSSAWAQSTSASASGSKTAAAGATKTNSRTPASRAQPTKRSTTAAPVVAAALPSSAADDVPLTAGQLEAAQHVFTGKADCEFGEQIDVNAVDGKPGHFQLRHRRTTYQLVPQETTTGAVRLEDKRAGIVWLQIPAKSMLMNAKVGQRVADNCLMAQQRS